MDIKDTRDIEARIDELEDLETGYRDLYNEYLPDMSGAEAAQKAQDETGFDANDRAELAELRSLREELEPYCDWHIGETLIAVEDFQEYAEQLAEDLGLISSHPPWPQCHIDWDAAAASLLQDYTEAGGYYVRAY